MHHLPDTHAHNGRRDPIPGSTRAGQIMAENISRKTLKPRHGSEFECNLELLKQDLDGLMRRSPSLSR